MNRPVRRDDGAGSPLMRGLSLLGLYGVVDVELTIGELARRSGIPKSTTHRLVRELVAWGALKPGPRGYRLGMRLFELGHLVPAQSTLRELAIPFAHNLHEVTSLTSNVAVRDGGHIVYIEKVSSRALRVPHSRPGGRASLHATALGKAILAFSEASLIDDVLSARLEVKTPKTLVDPAMLRAELARIRESRVAYDVEESRLGLFCVAAPVFGRAGAVVAAISVTGATALAEAEYLAPAVRTTAMALSRALSARPRG